MIITNNAKQGSMHYFIACTGASACGDLGPGDEAVLPSYNDKTNVTVTLNIWKTSDQMELTLNDSGL
jgi:hypothetical protein